MERGFSGFVLSRFAPERGLASHCGIRMNVNESTFVPLTELQTNSVGLGFNPKIDQSK